MNKYTPLKITIISIIVSAFWVIRFTDARQSLYIVIVLNMIGYLLMLKEYKYEAKKC